MPIHQRSDSTLANSHPQRQQFVASVRTNVALCREHYRLTLELPQFPPTNPGQFVQIACRDQALDCEPAEPIEWQPGQKVRVQSAELRGPQALLRRPFSLAGRRDRSDGATELDIIHRVVGTGTAWLAHLNLGQTVSILGPLGNHFEPPQPAQTALLVGGGVGIPPMLYLASQLQSQKAIAFCGATSADLLPLTIDPDDSTAANIPSMRLKEFAQWGVPSIVTTDDGSYGLNGFVTQALEQWLDKTAANGGQRVVIYTCGPEAMMKRVAQIAMARSIRCQIAAERAMACGMGTCQSCVIRIKQAESGHRDASQRWQYKLTCTDGPVFDAGEVLW